jgi:transposase
MLLTIDKQHRSSTQSGFVSYSAEIQQNAVFWQFLDNQHDPSISVQIAARSLYKWVKAVRPDPSEQRDQELVEAKSEILKLRAELRRTQEQRDILKKEATAYFARGSE